ncbi:hypothetical protein M3223_07520 [Paenibacillus pasadenensis]|uniref:hypothetical protein n=1 Tax=Paenibacillus pasadenensis TaxID=217090 RepID=UPI00203F0F08|nr:hypothetical protein [Paenibacillus pasadenensis]MCM3747202.1 hypothetical protein [Paenibacillus pasadenensis]
MNLKAKAIVAASLALLICTTAAAAANSDASPAQRSVRSASNQGSEFMNSLKKQAAAWQDELSAQPEFAAWSGAALKLEPLGPGGHSWLATVTDAGTGQSVGYMIVHAKPDGGFTLGEYGAGDAPLFETSRLEEGLRKANLTVAKRSKLYISPAVSVWRLTDAKGRNYYADASSGEVLPLHDNQWLMEAAGKAASAARLKAKNTGARHYVNASKYAHAKFVAAQPLTGSIMPKSKIRKAILLKPDDPFRRLAWLIEPALSDSSKQRLLSLMDAGRRIDYSAELYGGSIRLIGQAYGYHSWSDGRNFGAFSIAGAEGIRYWPLEEAAASGSFYPV